MKDFRCELLSAEQLSALATDLLGVETLAPARTRSLHRDIYVDTADDALAKRGVVCRLRTTADGRGKLTLRIADPAGDEQRIDAVVRVFTPAEALAEGNEVSRRVRGIVDPALLVPRVELEVDRLTRTTSKGWMRRPKLAVHLDTVTVRRDGNTGKFYQLCAHQLGGGNELRLLERSLEDAHGVRRSNVATRERAELAIKWARLEDVAHESSFSGRVHHAVAANPGAIPEFLNPELSILAFQQRVLAVAEDPDTPLGERFRFLAIVASNVDEFYMVRMASLLDAADAGHESVGDDGLTAAEELAEIRDAVRALSRRQAECARKCFVELMTRGRTFRRWTDLDDGQRAQLTDRFQTEMLPLLTPLAMTLSPGHPLPRLAHLSLGVALVLRDRERRAARFAELELPPSLPRFYVIDADLVALEEIVIGNLGMLYPQTDVEHAYMFRVTRTAELELDELAADDLLDEVSRAAAARGQGTTVRLEVERGMPPMLRALLLDDVRREQAAAGGVSLQDADDVDGLLDTRALSQIVVPGDASWPASRGRRVFEAGVSMFERIRRGSVLVHHPFESFHDSVERFIVDAAADPDVAAIKMTLYRIGSPSPIAEALLDAARGGKAVTVFIELKARFDEEQNVAWARALENAGGHVVRGIIGYKNHAKLSLIVRREGDTLQRYVHIGTGNYNARSGEQYTDLSLFTADPMIATDAANLFNDLTGMSEPPRRALASLLVAPSHLLTNLLEMIEREASHARAGRLARITAKLNGLSDPDIVRALYRASQDGVAIDLVVRGICTLRPGIPGRSAGIRVSSTVGRFLEHSRIYRFENDGAPRYFIGSADLRPRNLRRRVEIIAPIGVPEHQRRLDELLHLYVNDPGAWELGADGCYTRRMGGPAAQEELTMGGIA